MITITFAEPQGFREKEFQNENLTLKELIKLNHSEKDTFIDHHPIENGNLDISLIKDTSQIVVHDKLIDA